MALTGNNANQRNEDEHDFKNTHVKKVGLFGYESATDTYVRLETDADGNLNTTQQLSITQSIDETAYDLAAAPYSQVVTPDFDYIIDNFQLDFSTTESRTITLTSNNGTKIYEATNTNSSVALGSINFGQESGDSFTLAITQTSGACTVDIALYIKNSPVALTADPVTAPGSRVTLQDGGQTDISVTNALPMRAGDSPSIDAFARWRVSNPETLFDSKQIHDNQPLFWDDQEVSGGSTTSSHSTATASTTIGVALNTAGKRVRQTYQRFNYQSGKSQLILLTGTLGTGGGTGITRAMGIFDDNDGIFMQDDEGTIKAVVRSSASGSPVDTKVAQSSWNIDKLDGTGASGITLDSTKSQIVIIDYEWLGVGRVRIGFVIDGIPYYCHQFLNANNNAGVYMSTPNLPLRYEIENDGTGVASELEHICSSVMSEGGTQKTGALRHKDSGSVGTLNTGTVYAILGIRLKSGAVDAGVLLENLSILATTTNDVAHWELRFNPTVAGTFTYSDETNSTIQTATGASTNTVTGGTEIDGGYFSTALPVTSTTPNALKLGSAIDGTVDEIVLCARPVTNNITVEGSLTWRELS